MIPKISIAHPSARPHEWKKTRDLWLENAWFPDQLEYTVCFDWSRHHVTPEDAFPARVVWNYGRHCSVDATNTAAQCCTGEAIVVISDDIYPCKHWDVALRAIPKLWSGEECVLRVKTGGTADERGLLTVQILNRARFDRIGYLFHPSYVSMYADDEFTKHAERDGVIVDSDIMFRHEHWTTGERQKDRVYDDQNKPERYRFGKAVLDWRQQNGFPPQVPQKILEARARI